MGFQYTKLFRTLDLDVRIDGTVSTPAGQGLTIDFYTERPGEEGLIVRHSEILVYDDDPQRFPRSIDFPGDVRGRQFKIRATPHSTVLAAIYDMRVYAKILLPHGKTTFQWYAIPVVPTPVDWIEIALPIPATPDHYSEVPLPIPSTPDNFTEVPLPIPSTPDGWNDVAIPMRATPAQPSWVDLPVDD